MPASTTGRPAAVLSILVTANTRAAQANLAALDRQMAYTVSKTTARSQALQRSLIGMRYAAVGMAAGVAASVGAAISFESAFASVRKTVRATPREFGALRKGILQMSTEIPESANALAELAGEAGALGVKRKDLLSFTRTAAKLGTTTNLTSEAAADSLARLGNIMDKQGKGAFKRMASTLVDLGNKGASTEAEIASMSLRIAGAGKQVGLRTSEVEGFAAALANLGIRAEMGGSAISRVMLAMQAAIAAGGSEAAKFAEIAGMGPQEFAKSFKENVPQTIIAFAEGLNKIKENGGAVASELADLGKAAHTSMGDIRVRDTLLRMAGNTDEVSRAMRVANSEWDQNNALTRESQQRYRTLASQVDLLKNSITKVGIDLGTSLLPDLKDMVEILQSKDLTLGEKAEQVIGKLVDVFQKAAPKIAEIGGKVALGIGEGIVQTFIHANIWGKLFEAALILRLIGGPGVLMKIGVALGTPIATSLASTIAGTAFVTAMRAQMAGSMVALAEGGPAWFSPARLSPLGASLGRGIALATRFAIPGAFAAAGIANILADVLGGDMKGAGFELGGALAGGIAGFFIGGPAGAMIGGGIGTVLGDALGDLFGGGEKQLKPLQQALKTAREDLKRTAVQTKAAAVIYKESGREVQRAQAREKKTSEAVKEAEDKLHKARRRYGPDSRKVIEAEGEVTAAKRRERIATQRLQHADRVHGKEKEVLKRAYKGEYAASKQQIFALKDERDKRLQALKAAERQGASAEVVTKRLHKYQDTEQKLSDAQRRHADLLEEINRTIGPDFAQKVGKMTGAQAEFGHRGEVTAHTLRHDLIPQIKNASGESLDLFGVYRDHVPDFQRGNQQMGDSSTNMAQVSFDAFSNVEHNVRGAAGSLDGVEIQPFGLVAPGGRGGRGGKGGGGGGGGGGGKQRGGIVPGIAAGDRHTLALGGEPIARVESGEYIGVINREAVKTVDAINANVPRYGGGGTLPGDTAGVHPEVLNYVTSLYRRFGGSSASGLRAGDSGSFHSQGLAIDYVPEDWGGAARAVNAAGPGLLEGIYNPGMHGPPAVSWDSGQNVPSSFWGSATWGDHLDHIHIAVGKAIAGAVGAVVKEIAKQTMTGPEGALRNVGQASIDKVTELANKFIAKHTPMQGPGEAGYIPGGGGPVVMQIGRILEAQRFTQSGNAGIIGNAYAESNWDPGAVGTGGGGLWGFTTSPISLADLQNYAKQNNQPWTDVGIQTQFMLNHLDASVRSAVNNAGSPEAAAERFMTLWERPGIPALDRRQAGARQAYGMIASLYRGTMSGSGHPSGRQRGDTVLVGDSLTNGMLRYGGGFPGGWRSAAKDGAAPDWGASKLNEMWGKGDMTAVFPMGTNGTVATLRSALGKVKHTIGDKAGLALMTLAGEGIDADDKNKVIKGFNRADALANWAGISSRYMSGGFHPDGPPGYQAMKKLVKDAGQKAKEAAKRRFGDRDGDHDHGHEGGPKHPHFPHGGHPGSFENILPLPKFLRAMIDAGGPGDRRSLVHDAQLRIKERTALGFLSEDGSELAGALGELLNQADLQQENADFANDLTGDSPIPLKFQNKTELEWLQEELKTYWKLRNRLIGREGKLTMGLRRIKHLMAEIKGPNGILQTLNKRVNELKNDVAQLEKERGQLQKELEKASGKAEKDQEKIKAQLQKELDKPKKKQDKKLIAKLRAMLEKKGSSEKDAVQAKLDRNFEKTQEKRHELVAVGATRDALREPIYPLLQSRKSAVVAGQRTLDDDSSGLAFVQGRGVSKDDYSGHNLGEFPIGTFKGEIGRLQIAIRDYGGNTGAADEFTISDLIEFAQATQLGGFRSIGVPPYMGAFQKGGLALVGESGPELAAIPHGTRVVSAAESKQALGAQVLYIDKLQVGETTIAEHVEIELSKFERRQRSTLRARPTL